MIEKTTWLRSIYKQGIEVYEQVLVKLKKIANVKIIATDVFREIL